MLASLVLGFSMFGALRELDLMWLHLTSIRRCSDVTIWEASPDVGILRAYPPFFAPRDAMLTMLVCTACWLSMHLYTLDYMPMHESSVSSMLQRNEVMDIRSKPTFVPRGHNLLFAFLLVCLLACACFLVALLAMSIMLICFMPH